MNRSDDRFSGSVDSVALVTGGNSGIGKATALAFAAAGARVVVAARGKERGRAVVQQIRDGGGEATFVRTDVSRADEVEAMVRVAVETYGGLDVAVNNAGTTEGLAGAPLADVAESDFDRQVAVNLKGVFLCMKYEIPALLARGSGAVVNICSYQGLYAGPGVSPYTAAKHGVLGLTKTAALEYVNQGIRINAICPGAVRTPMLEEHAFRLVSPEDPPSAEAAYKAQIPAGRIAEPHEIAEAVLWLCSEAASYVIGQGLVVDGGWAVR